VREGVFDEATTLAESEAVGRLLERQSDIEATNVRLLEQERVKRERFYDYRAQAAVDKLEANRRILERIKLSPEDADRRILPVWEKNVDSAERTAESIEHERAERLAQLSGRDHVTAQHELLTASYVVIEPDPQPLFDRIGEALTPSMFLQFKQLCERARPEELTARRPALEKRRVQLVALAEKHRFQVRLATSIADGLMHALDRLDGFAPSELSLLNGAIGYYLELDDEAHDLKDPKGFEDDAQVARVVLEVLGRGELAAEIDASKALA
jgi:hypothetical protein